MPGTPPARNEAFTFYCALTSQANTNVFQTNPTLAGGDAQVSTDGGAFGNLATLPVVSPAGDRQVQVDSSAAEMNGDAVGILLSDVAGGEWQDLYALLLTSLPVKGEAFTIYVVLVSQADTNIFQVNPTIAAGDARISGDGGALGNLTTLPVVTPAGSKQVKVDVTAAEANVDMVGILFNDVAGNQWQSLYVEIGTNGDVSVITVYISEYIDAELSDEESMMAILEDG